MSEWIRIGATADVPLLEGRAVTVGDQRVAIFRLPDGWAAVDAACPHRGGPLQDGLVADSCVTCPLHGRRFDLRSGARIGGDGAINVHEVREHDGALWLRTAVGARAA